MGRLGWIDSHAHLSADDYQEDIERVLENCTENNITRILTICLTFEELEKAFEIQKRDSRIDIAMAFFPTDYYMMTDENWHRFEEVIEDPRIVAIGEMGLDYYWEKDEELRSKQREVFIRQIELAKKVNKPILVHSRDAAQDTYDILKKMEHKGVLHCYSYSSEMAKEFIKLGYLISLAGPVTFKSARVPKEVAMETPLEKILIETDSPYLTPEPNRGKRNEPAYVKYIGEYICELKSISEEELQEHIQQNYWSMFHTGK